MHTTHLTKLTATLFIQFLLVVTSFAQDSAAFHWEVTSRKISTHAYALTFQTPGNAKWELYGPNEVISEVPAMEIEIDSAIRISHPYEETGASKMITSVLFENKKFKVYEGPMRFDAILQIDGPVPAKLLGKLIYTYGKGEEFYSGNGFAFEVPLEGGIASAVRIKVNTFDLAHPVSSCGDENTAGKSLAGIFLLGFLGGLIALFTPCVFPLIPLTVSFFTKQSQDKRQGIFNAVLYGAFIFLIYVALSVPFHLVSGGKS